MTKDLKMVKSEMPRNQITVEEATERSRRKPRNCLRRFDTIYKVHAQVEYYPVCNNLKLFWIRPMKLL